MQQRIVEVLGVHTHAWYYGDDVTTPVQPTTGEEAGHGQGIRTDTARVPLILVHGFRGDHHGLEGIALTLVRSDPSLHVIVPDLPGFGDTPAVPGRTHDLQLFGQWLCEFAETVSGGAGYAILGHSFGSLVVAHALAQGLTPTRVMLVNPIAESALNGPRAFITLLTLGYYRIAELLPEAGARWLLGNPLIVQAMSEIMAKTRDLRLRGWIHEQHHRYFSRFADSRTLLQAFRASVAHTVTEYAYACTAPTLLIAGERDDITPLSAQLRLAKRLSAKLRVMPGVGHLVHYEAVAETAAAIEVFLREKE